MTKILEDLTIESFSEAVRRGQIRPDQRFSVVFDDEPRQPRPKLAEIAIRMRTAAAERGMTTEIFDRIIAED